MKAKPMSSPVDGRRRKESAPIHWCPSCDSHGTVGGFTRCEICGETHGPFVHATPRENQLRRQVVKLESRVALLEAQLAQVMRETAPVPALGGVS